MSISIFKKALRGSLYIFLVFMFLSNFTRLRQEFPGTFPHWYSADKGQFQALERGKGHDPVGSIRISFEQYKVKYNKPDLILYRRFSKQWWQVWNWYYFMTAPCWDFPYAARDEDT